MWIEIRALFLFICLGMLSTVEAEPPITVFPNDFLEQLPSREATEAVVKAKLPAAAAAPLMNFLLPDALVILSIYLQMRNIPSLSE